MRFLLKLVKWTIALVLLLIVGLAAPVAYVELACRGEVRPVEYTPLISEAEFRRPEANTYLTYPEWHIVYAYDGLAETLKSGDEHRFDFTDSVLGFWTSTCALMRIADAHGGADQQTRIMIHTIGASFTLEMGLKAAYEETVGRLFADLRGPVKTPQDQEALAMAIDYATFLRQTPWYSYDFAKAAKALWAAPMTDPMRGWERRLALGGEWHAKALYARAIAAGVAATGVAKLEIRSVVTAISADRLREIEGVVVVAETPDGIVIETPRYALFTRILAAIVARGGAIREIAGNDDVMVSLTMPDNFVYEGPGEVIARLPRQGFTSDRLLVNLRTSDLSRAFQSMPIGEPGIEHVYDY
jgi:hypothetical protein